jgi:hypothetical protein
MAGFGNVGDSFGLARFSEDIRRGTDDFSRKIAEKDESHRSMNYMADLAKASTAKEFYDRLNSEIKRFDESLDEQHEVGVKLVTFGQSVTFHVTRLGYQNPSLIFFYGVTADDDRVQLIQHVSQISFVLLAMDKPSPEEPKRPFGFEAYQPPADPMS